MRIGFDAKRAFNNTSGLGNYSRFVINSLATHFPQEELFLFTPKYNKLFQHFFPKNSQITLINPAGIWKKAPSLWRTFGQNSSIRKNKIAIYHGLSNEIPANIQKTGAKTVVTIHDLIFLRYPELYKPLDRIIYKQKFKTACQKADKIIAISEQTKTDIIDFFGIDASKIEVIYQDCNPAFHKTCTPQQKQEVKEKYKLPDDYLLCVGTHEPRKNQLNLIKAWHQSGSDLELVFVGKKTAYTNQLKQYVSENKLEAKVNFLPYIPFQDLPAIYQQATIFAYPSVFEGFGIPILEALNSGVPVIASTGSCFSEAGGSKSFYISPDNIEELSRAIRKVSHEKALRDDMIAAGKEHALQFRPEKTIAQLHALYSRLLNQ